MPIEQFAHSRYSHQYRTCYYFCLLLLDSIDNIDDEHIISVISEPENGEDGRITIDGNIYEIQVKNELAQVKIETLAKWLAHFPPHDHEKALIERLYNGELEQINFCVASRCDDRTSSLVSRMPWTYSLESGGFLDEHLNIFLDALKNEYDRNANSSLSRNRFESISNFISKSNTGSNRRLLLQCLHKINIFENMTADSIKNDLRSKLQTGFSVPLGKTDDVIRRFESLASENPGKDLYHASESILQSYKKQLLTPIDFLASDFDDSLALQIETKNILLLSGMPWCGKTYLAKFLCGQYQRRGFSCVHTQSIDEAIRELSDTTSSHKICLLEDPLGSIRRNATASLDHDKLIRLLDYAQPHRKLIVTQRKDIILQVARQDIPMIATYRWLEIPDYRIDLLLKVWDRDASQNTVPENISTVLRHLIETNAIHITPRGCSLLAERYEEINDLNNLPSIEHVANIYSADIFNSLIDEEESYAKILTALVIAANNITGVKKDDLLYILLNENRECIYTSEDFGTVFSFPHENNETIYDFPVYPEYPSREKTELLRLLKKLVQQRIIIFNNDCYVWSHPCYYDLGIQSLKEFDVQIAIEQLSWNALHCLSSSVRKNSVENIIEKIIPVAEYQEYKKALLRMIYDLSNDRFLPEARSFAITKICGSYDLFEGILKDEDNVIFRWQRNEHVWDYEWHGNEPWIPTDKKKIFWPQSVDIRPSSFEQLDEETSCLDYNRELIENLLYLKKHPEFLTKNIFNKLMTIHDSAFRTSLIDILFLSDLIIDDAIISTMQNDYNPHVRYSFCINLLNNWASFPLDQKAHVSRMLSEYITKATGNCLMPQFLIYHRDDSSFKGTREWEIFGKTFAICLSLNVSISNSARFYALLQEGKRHWSQNSMCDIIFSYIAWLNHKYTVSVADDFLLGIIPFCLSVRDIHDHLRIYEALFSIQETSVRLSFIEQYISSWEEISSAEKSFIIDLFDRKSKDFNWLVAVLLTMEVQPGILQERIWNSDNYIESITAENIKEKLPEDILHHVFSIYSGNLDCFGLRCKNDRISGVIEDYAWRHPEHGIFRVYIGRVINFNIDSLDGLIEEADLFYLEIIFDELLQYQITAVEQKTQMAKVIEKIDNLDHAKALSCIAQVALNGNKIFERINELFFLKGDLLGHFISNLPKGDQAVLRSLILWNNTNQDNKELMNMIECIYKVSPPEFYCTNDFVTLLKNCPPGLKALAEEKRKALIHDRYDYEYLSPKIVIPKDWYFIAENKYPI